MFNFINFLPGPLLGLDIQPDEIRLLQVGRYGKKRQIKQALAIELPAGAVVEGHIQEIEFLSDRLQELARRFSPKSVEVAIALSSQYVKSQRISVVKGLREPELEAEVTSHLANSFQGITEGLCYDYVMLDAKNEVQNEVFLAATPFSYLNQYVTAVQNAGLKVHVVDIDSYALARAKHYVKKNNFNVEEKWLVSVGLALRSRYL